MNCDLECNSKKHSCYERTIREAVTHTHTRTLTWKLLIALHPSDGGGGLTAHGRAGHLRFVALAQDLVAGVDEGATWRHYIREKKKKKKKGGVILSTGKKMASRHKLLFNGWISFTNMQPVSKFDCASSVLLFWLATACE